MLLWFASGSLLHPCLLLMLHDAGAHLPYLMPMSSGSTRSLPLVPHHHSCAFTIRWHYCALLQTIVATADGRAFGWGADDFGQAGSDTNSFKAAYNVAQRPTQLKFPGATPADKVVDVGAGFVHSFAITCQFD